MMERSDLMTQSTVLQVDGKQTSESAFRSAARRATESFVLVGDGRKPTVMAAFTESAPSKEWLVDQGMLERHSEAGKIASRHLQTNDRELEAAKNKLKALPRQFFDGLRHGTAGPVIALPGQPLSFAMLYEDCNWGGASLWLPPGSYPDFRRVWPWSGNWNDRVSSLSLFFVVVVLFADTQFRGARKWFAGVVGANTNPVGINCLVADGFNDVASSAMVF